MGRGTVLRGGIVVFFLASAVGAGRGAQAQANPCAAPATDTGFAEITVNVQAGTFDKVLPFDVPVRLCGQVAAGTEWVRIQVAEARQPLEVEADTCRISAPAGVAWQPVPPLEARIDTSTNAFRAVLPRLDAQRYYAFCFRLAKRVTEEQASAFKPVARQALDAGLRPVRSGDISAEDSARLRASLSKALLASTGADEVLAPGTLFDPDLPQDQVRGEFNARVVAVLEPQVRRLAVLEGRPAGGGPATASWGSLQFDLRKSLDGVRTDAALSALAAALDAAAASNPNLRALLDQDFRAALALPGLSSEAAARVAQGQDPAGETPSPPLPEEWDPTKAGEAAARYQATSDAFEALSDLVARMTGAEAPAEVAAAISAEQRGALAALAAPGGPVRRGGDLAFTLSGLAGNLRTSLEARAAALDALAAEVALAAQQVQVADGSTSGNFDTFKSYYVSADAGLVWAPEVDEVVSYVGANIYLRPVNKNAPLRTLGSFGETFGRRFAFTLALTVQSIADSEGGETTREDLFGNQALLAGAGLRITDMIRFGAGALVFKRQDPDPLVDELEVAVSYYLTVSFDLNVARAFQGGLGGLFGGS
jgi:hypothetical protein